MIILRRFFTLFGVLCFVVLCWLGYNGLAVYRQFDPQAFSVYWSLGQAIVETKNAAEATTWIQPVEEGVSTEEVEEAMKSVANEHNIKLVAELPLYKQVEAIQGEKYRYVKIFMFCNAATAAQMLDYSDAFSAYLPCRITLVEDKSGRLWLYSLNMDMMIYGGAPLPVALKAEAIAVKKIILDIMARGAAGDF